MKPGIVSKKDVDGDLLLERKMLGINQAIKLKRERCIGCGICVATCPQEASELSSPVIEGGRLTKSGFADINARRCTFCGVCVVLCPANAIDVETNGKRNVRVVESGVFPALLKEIGINVKKCRIECKNVCQDSCPTKAIEVVLKGTEKGETPVIENVNVDEGLCIFCKKCESACPAGAVGVTGPFSGLVELSADSCPDGCQVCVDACPSKVISIAHNCRPAIDERFCIYCGTCQEACPRKIISVRRTRILHTEISSGAWIRALEKLTSRTELGKELTSRACRKMREASKSVGRF